MIAEYKDIKIFTCASKVNILPDSKVYFLGTLEKVWIKKIKRQALVEYTLTSDYDPKLRYRLIDLDDLTFINFQDFLSRNRQLSDFIAIKLLGCDKF